MTCGEPPPPKFVRGACNGEESEPSIASVVFGLDYLFRRGTTPPCRAACDANDDDHLDLSDMVYLLLRLFANGAPPAGASGCVDVSQEDECETPHPDCS